MRDIDQQWNFNDPSGSEKTFRSQLADLKKGSNDYLEVLTQIARAQGLQKKFKEAHRSLDAVEGALKADKPRVLIRYLLERGRVFNSADEKPKAKPLFMRAFKLGNKIKDNGLTIDAAHMMAIIESRPKEQLRWNKLALALAEKSKSPKAKKWRASLYNNLAWTYHDMNQFEKALDLFQRALPLREAQGEAENIRFARWCIARALRSLNRYQEALEIQEALQRQLKKQRASDEDVNSELEALHRALKN